MSSAYAHTTIYIDKYEIEAGWGVEPPVVDLLNKITIDVGESGEVKGVTMGITNAFKNMQATVMSGGVSKVLDIAPEPVSYTHLTLPTKA